MSFQQEQEHHQALIQELPVNGTAPAIETVNRYAAAGRKGAQRIHELIQEGLIYEKEHGLKRGRQRLRQLIQQGKLYEQEHGLRSAKPRRARQNPDQAVQALLKSLNFLVKPAYRDSLLQAMRAIEAVEASDPLSVEASPNMNGGSSSSKDGAELS